ncbi:MAG: heparinase II/III family protein [Rhodomicrobium sp.]
MSLPGAILKARRTIAFARHVPIAKLARRAELTLRRSVGGRLPARAEPLAAFAVQPEPPLPVFAPRTHLAPKHSGGNLQFSFLNRTIEMEKGGVDWSAPGPISSNQLWRMNLHYMEYLEGADAKTWQRLVLEWIASNPKSKPGAWQDSWNSYALSLRTVVWLQELARRAKELPSDAVSAAETSAIEQIRFLERNLETDLGGNHLIKNIKALIWASAYFASEEAGRWRGTALRLLSKELPKQILADGMHDERSASYHAQVFADLLECRHALGTDPLAGALDEALHRMAQVSADLTHPDGGPVLFNDSGLTMAYSPAECLDVYERLYGRRPRTRRSFAFEAAGYYGMRSDELYMVADLGRIAPDDLPAHGHGDVLSFELSAAGRRIVVDQGVFEYVAGEKRQRARAAWSHNTLCFEGADQADFFGAFRCGRRPDVMVLTYEALQDGFILEGTHNGFRNLPGKPRHVRRIEASSNRIVIDDSVEGNAGRAARIGFLLHPSVEASFEGRTATLRHGPAVIRVTSSAAMEIEPAVWWPDMGVELKTSRLVLRLSPPIPAVRIEFQSGE